MPPGDFLRFLLRFEEKVIMINLGNHKRGSRGVLEPPHGLRKSDSSTHAQRSKGNTVTYIIVSFPAFDKRI